MTRSLRTVGKIPASVDDPRLKDFLESIRQRVNAYEQRILQLESEHVVEDWHVVGAAGEPALEGAWSVAGGRAIQFYKDPLGVVRLRGAVTGGTGTIFTLPEGYRPDQAPFFACYQGGIAETSVSTAGVVAVINAGTGGISLDPMFFRAA